MKPYAALLVAALALGPSAALAQGAENPNDAGPPTFSRTASDADSSFVYRMLQQARVQIALAHIAQSRAQRSSTRDVASRELARWTDIRDRLASIASVQGMNTPSDADGQGTVDRLSGLSSGFDDAYQSFVTQADARALHAIRKERRSVNPALISFANDHLNGI